MQENAKKERWVMWGFWAVYSLVFVGVAYKAFTVPITHDEGWTVIQYLDASFWEIMMYPDNWPNNHILNTLLAKISAGIFGVSDWSVRLPSLLFFWVYAYGVYRFLRLVLKDRMLLFIPTAALFILSPYFLDFFGLCRGYGISSALTMLSVSYFVSGFVLQKRNHIWIAYGFALVASYANFTVLLFFAASCLIAALYFLLHRKSWLDVIKNWGIQLTIFLGYVMLIYVPIYKMKSTNQFEFWTSKGFYEETVFSVIHNSLTNSALYTNHEVFAILVVVLTLLLWIFGIRKIVKSSTLKSAFQSPIVIIGSILLTTVLINLLQTLVLGDPNLNGRTALFLLPIFLSLITCGIAYLPKGNKNWVSISISAILLLVTVQHLGMSYRPNSFKEWRYDEYTDDVITYLDAQEGHSEGKLVCVDWLFFNSFAFYKKYESGAKWTLAPSSNGSTINPNADYCYVPEERVEEMLVSFEIVKTYKGGQTLMRSK